MCDTDNGYIQNQASNQSDESDLLKFIQNQIHFPREMLNVHNQVQCAWTHLRKI